MAGPFKVVLFFELGGHGWSETYYSGTLAPDSAYAHAFQLQAIRKQLLGEPAQLTALRVSDEANPRSSSLTPQVPKTTWGYTAKADIVPSTAMMRLYSSGQQRTRAVYLRGNPDAAYDLESPNNADRQTWIGTYSTLGQFLTNTGSFTGPDWLIKYRPRPVLGTNTIDITGWAPNVVSTKTTVTTAVATGAARNNFVDVYKIKGLPFAPGQCLVVEVNVNPLVIEVRYRTPSDYTYEGGAYLVAYAPGYDTLTAFSSQPRYTRRDTGRPSGASRGRRRAILR